LDSTEVVAHRSVGHARR